MSAPIAPLLLSLLLPQDPGSAPPDPLTTLTEQVREAHGASLASAATDRFTARIEIEPPAEQEHVVVALDVRFWREGAARPRSLIRYKIDEHGKKLERGRDTRGFWNLIDGEVKPLGDRNSQTDRQEVERHVRLAKQMLEFLDPGALLASLTTKTAPRDDVLKIGRSDTVPCQIVTGTAASFPLYGTAGEGQHCRVSLWIEAETHRLAAIDAVPLDKDGRPQAAGELIRLRDYVERPADGHVLPTGVVIYQHDQGNLRRLATVTVKALDLQPDLTEASFDREKAWN